MFWSGFHRINYRHRKHQWAFFDFYITKTVSCLHSNFIFAIYCCGADKGKWQAPYKWKMVEIFTLVVSSRSYKVLPIPSTRCVGMWSGWHWHASHRHHYTVGELNSRVSCYTHRRTHVYFQCVIPTSKGLLFVLYETRNLPLSYRPRGCPIPGGVQGQTAWSTGQLDLVGDSPAYVRRLELGMLGGLFQPNHTVILWLSVITKLLLRSRGAIWKLTGRIWPNWFLIFSGGNENRSVITVERGYIHSTVYF